MELTKELGGRHVRSLIDDALSAWEIHDPSATVRLVVTELIENVHQHANGSGKLQLELHDGHVLVQVSDTSPRLPEVRDPVPTLPTGRGMRLVQILSTAWGVRPESAGKVVWAQLAVDGGTISGNGGTAPA
jgi:two-component sensor histidine kinase